MKKSQRIKELKKQIAHWDELAKTNTEDNIHNLSTSERQDLVDQLLSLIEDE